MWFNFSICPEQYGGAFDPFFLMEDDNFEYDQFEIEYNDTIDR